MINVYEGVDQNKRRSLLVMVAFVVVVTLFVWFLAQVLGYGPEMVGFALVLAGMMSFASYWWSDKIILTISGARPASKEKDFLFFTVAENLALAAQIPMPKLYVIDDSAPNAFATGRDPQHAVVCATTGLLTKLDRTELEGVVAHELSHVRNYDIRLMSLVTVLVGMITLLADWFIRGVGRSRDDNKGNLNLILFLVGILFVLLSPLIAQLIKLALSRRRELLADASAVLLTRQPDGLARALEKISADKEPLEAANKATAHLYITNPLKNRHDQIGWFASWFNTHPPIEARIQALRAMG
ncbi:MAG: M48 family metallopeptidase [Candidatus Marinimicrobia bacterium]|nr:M48 family metallopeptidase [Candidatus Neomarinimicrobiota bacterium]